MSTAPSWTAAPPAEVWSAVIDSAEYAAHGDESRSATALADSDHDIRLLAIVGIRLLAAVIAEGVNPDDIRHGVLELAARSGATDLSVTNALETLAMAQALAGDDMAALHELCSDSQFSAMAHAVMSTGLSGQAIRHVAADPAGVFNRLRRHGGAA